MKILALDPSSSITGYAILNGETIVEAGRIRGKSKAAPIARVLAMRGELIEILHEHDPKAVVIELPLEKQYTRHPERKSGMAVWAGAAWALWAFAYEWAFEKASTNDAYRTELGTAPANPLLYPVPNTWTAGSTKDERKLKVSLLWPPYKTARDEGGDIADAICLGLWWAGQHQQDEIARAIRQAVGR